jgi:hypothetical protein
MVELVAAYAPVASQCLLRQRRTSRIFSLSGVNTDGFADGTATLVVIGVAESDMIDVKSGVTTAAFTVRDV